jgi:hypothetical protein
MARLITKQNPQESKLNAIKKAVNISKRLKIYKYSLIVSGIINIFLLYLLTTGK